MIVNLPNWATMVNGISPWTTNIMGSFLPAVYWEIGLAVGVFVVLLVIGLVTGALQSLLGAFGAGSDPMRGIPSGNSGMGGYTSRGGFGRIGGFVNKGSTVSPMATWAGARWRDRSHGLASTGFNRKETVQDRHDKYDAKVMDFYRREYPKASRRIEESKKS